MTLLQVNFGVKIAINVCCHFWIDWFNTVIEIKIKQGLIL